MNEYLLSVDNYNKPKKVSGKKAEYYAILKLLLTNKGTNPLFPDMGVGLVQRYRYMSEDDLSILEEETKDQITRYLPELLINEVNFQIIDGELNITVSSSETKTNYTYTASQIGLDNEDY